MSTITTDPIPAQNIPLGSTIESDAEIFVLQTIASALKLQRVPTDVLQAALIAGALLKNNNLSDLENAAEARENLGTTELYFVSGTGAPGNGLGKPNDWAVNENGGFYQKTGASAWTSRLDAATAADITAAINAHLAATDPHGQYLTQTEANALYQPLGESGAPGLRFVYNSTTNATGISNGQIRFDNTTFSAISQIFLSETDRNGASVANVEDLISSSLRIQVANEANEEAYIWMRVTGTPTDNGAYRTIPVAFISTNGTIATGSEVSIGLFGGGGLSSITVREIDGTPSISAVILEVPNGSLSDQGGGVGRITLGSGLTRTAISTDVTDAAHNTVYQATGSPTVTANTSQTVPYYFEVVSDGSGTPQVAVSGGQTIVVPGSSPSSAVTLPAGGTVALEFMGGSTFVVSKLVGTPTLSGATAPFITSFTPTRQDAGGNVVISGGNFTGATAVKFGTTDATSFAVNSASQITAVVPTGLTVHKISVTTPDGTGTSSQNFSVFRVYDDFTGPDNAVIIGRTPTFGPNWYKGFAVSDNGAILSNKATRSSSTLFAFADIGVTSGTLQADFATGTVAAGNVVAFYVRGTSTDGACIIIQVTNNTVKVLKYDGSAVTGLSDESFSTPASGSITITWTTSQISVNINSSAYTKTVTNSDYNSQTGVGFSASAAGYTVDNFRAS